MFSFCSLVCEGGKTGELEQLNGRCLMRQGPRELDSSNGEKSESVRLIYILISSVASLPTMC